MPQPSELPYIFALPGVKPGASTAVKLVTAAIRHRPVVIEIRSTLALDLQSQPLEAAIAKLREIVALDKYPDHTTISMIERFDHITLGNTQTFSLDEITKAIQRRLAVIPTEALGLFRVFLGDPPGGAAMLMLRYPVFRATAHDQRGSTERDIAVYCQSGRQFVGSYFAWSKLLS